MVDELQRNTMDDYERRKRKQIATMRSLLDYGIGLVIAGVGIFFFFRDKFDIPFNQNYPPNTMDKVFGAICFLYGCWRIYRGYKKNYFK